MSAKIEATIEDLYRVEGKAEIVNGEIVYMSPAGFKPGYAAAETFVSLREYARRTKRGRAVTDNVGFIVNLPNRRSFCPDAAYYVGKSPGMKFFDGAPVFAVEVRSENDYGARAEAKLRDKIKDYFAAGTQIVWDVDLLSETVAKKYDARNPENPTVFRRGETADAESAVPGWTMKVDDLFE